MNEGISVFDVDRSGKWFKRPFIRIIAAVVLIVIVASIGVGGWFYYQSTTPALIIGDKSISKSQYKNIVAQAKAQGVKEPQAKDTIIAYERERIVAVSAKLYIDQYAIDSLVKGGDPKNANQWQKMVAYRAAFDNSLQLMKDPGFRAAVYYFPFSRYFDISGNRKPTDPKFNNQSAINEDKAYAKQLALDYRKKIKNKEITPEKALEEIKANQRLVYGSSRNNSNLISISSQGNVPLDGFRSYDMTYLSVLPFIENLKVGEVSDIQSRKSVPSYQPNSQGTGSIETSYFFTYLIQDNRDQKNDSGNIEKLLKAVKVKENV